MKKELNMDEIKTIEFQILTEIDSFCKKNNIRYFLTFGTLLGAIRHKGFIPWDDDIDIFIPREDYNRFINTFKSERYICYSYETHPNYPFDFAKVIDSSTIKEEPIRTAKNIQLGIDVDVFPLNYYYFDGFDKKIYKSWKKYCALWRISVSKFKHRNIFKTVVYFPIKATCALFRKQIVKKIDHLTNSRSGDYPIGYITAFCVSEKIRTYKLEWFDGVDECLFEGKKFNVPRGYDELLTNIYGDYMKLPSKENRISHHRNKCFYK